METRKVQISGGSTFIVSLPKKWAVKNGIGSGSSVNILEDRTGNLILSTRPVSFREVQTGEIKLTGKESTEAIMRRLVGAYVSGVNQIEVKGKTAIPAELSRTVREFTRLVMGVEIVEEKKDLIRLHDLIDPADFSVRSGLKRMAYITEQMISDSLKGLMEPNPPLMDDVIMRDIEVDRISWLIHKEYNMMSRSPKMADKAKLSPEDALNYLIASRVIERVADHANSMAVRLRDAEVTAAKEFLRSIYEEGVFSQKVFTESVSSLLSQDLSLADSVIDRARAQKKRLDPLLREAFKLPPDEAVLLAFILNSIDRISSYGGDIGKTALNRATPIKK